MSAAATAWAWAVVPRLGTASASVVLLHLAEAVNDSLTYAEPQEHIARKTGLSPRTVQDALRALADDGLIKRERLSALTGRIPDAIALQVNLSAILAGPNRQEPLVAAPLDAKSAGSVSAKFADSDDGEALRSNQPAKSAGLTRAESPGPRDSNLREGKESLAPESAVARDDPTPRMQAIAKALWSITPPVAQNRGGGPQRIAWAIRDAVARGEDAEAIFGAMTAYLNDPDTTKQDGRYCTAPQRAIENGKWKSWAAPPGAAPQAVREPGDRSVLAPRAGVRFTSPEGKTLDEMGTLDDPGPQRQLLWLADYDFSKIQWRDWERGPAPDEPGCRIWPEVARWYAEQKGRGDADG